MTFVVSTPQGIRVVGVSERGPTGLVASALASFDQTMTIKHCMYGALCGWFVRGTLAQQLLSNLGCAPVRMLLFDSQYRSLKLKRESIGMTVGSATTIFESIQADIFTDCSHLLAVEKPGHKFHSFIHTITLIPWHLGASQIPLCVTYVSGIICNLCVNIYRTT